MNLTAIACMASNRVIGGNRGLPWSHAADMRFFKGKTLGHTVIMGRKTWESLGERPLPNRRNIVISRTPKDVPGVLMLRDVDALRFLNPEPPVFVIGGAETYRLLMPWTTEVLLTVLDPEVRGDTLMPEFEHDFHPPQIIDRAPGVEWRRYVRKPVVPPPSSALMDTMRALAGLGPSRMSANQAREHLAESVRQI